MAAAVACGPGAECRNAITGFWDDNDIAHGRAPLPFNFDAISATIGIDVAKARLDGWEHPAGRSWSIDCTDPALAQLTAELVSLQPTRIIVEAAGGLETRLVAELGAAGLPVVVVNPRQVREGSSPGPRAAWPRPTVWTLIWILRVI